MTATVRTIEVHELADWVSSMGAGFFHDIADGYAEYFAPQVDFDRTWGAKYSPACRLRPSRT
jgi:hypothetical protein